MRYDILANLRGVHIQIPTWSFIADGFPGIAGAGLGSITVPIPKDPTLLGFKTNWQGFVMDPGSPLPIGVSTQAVLRSQWFGRPARRPPDRPARQVGVAAGAGRWRAVRSRAGESRANRDHSHRMPAKRFGRNSSPDPGDFVSRKEGLMFRSIG